jgi:hypothetical protein
MNNLLKSLGILGIVVSIILFLYGSTKFARADQDEITEVKVYEAQMAAGKKAFTTAGLLFVGGIILLVVGRKSK